MSKSVPCIPYTTIVAQMASWSYLYIPGSEVVVSTVYYGKRSSTVKEIKQVVSKGLTAEVKLGLLSSLFHLTWGNVSIRFSKSIVLFSWVRVECLLLKGLILSTKTILLFFSREQRKV